MYKWLLWGLLNISGVAVCGHAFAVDIDALLPTNDFKGCSALIQQGDAVPPIPSNDLQSIQICTHSCDQLYKSLSDQGKTQDFLRGITYCHKSLSNLYSASSTQIIYDQLNQQTKDNEALQQQDFLEKVSAMIKQKQEQSPQEILNYEPPAASNTVASAPAVAAPKGPPENVNW